MNEINYAFWIIMIVVVAPVYCAGAFVIIEDEDKRRKVLIWGGLCGTLFFAFLVFKQMNIEETYGKGLVEYWYLLNKEVE